MASTPPFTADAAAPPANAARRSTPTTLDARSAADQGTCFLPGDTVVRTLNKLVEHRKALDQWDSGPVMIEVATSFTNPTLKSIDLSSTIGHGKSVPRKGKRTDENCYWLNAEWTSNDVDFRQSTVIPYFIAAASKAGFRITGAWARRYSAILFSCMRGRCNDQDANKKHHEKRRPTKNLKRPNKPPVKQPYDSQRPPKLSTAAKEEPELADDPAFDEDTCKYRFRVSYDDQLKRWFLPHTQSGCRHHNGHPHIDLPCLRMQPRHVLDKNEIEIAESALKSEIGAGRTAEMVHKRTDVSLDWNQVHYMRKKQEQNDFPDIPIGTSADKLAHILSRDDVSSISLYADFNSNLLTVKQKKRANKGEQLEETVFDDDLGDDTDSPEDFARDMDATIRQNLTNSVTGQILLCAVWTTDEGKRKFDMYPEFVSVDDTEGTNAEERPLHNWCAKDGNNEIFNFLAAYLPSKAQWAYTFVFRAGGILFRKGNALSRVIKINSDADKQET